MKRSLIALTFSVFASMAFQGCVYDKPASPDTKNNTQELRWLYSAIPQVDVNSAIAREDFRFRSINGVGAVVPGIYINCLDRATQINPIKGTSDVNESREHEKLNKLAVKYAKSYNTKMLKHIMDTQNFGCEG